jgi:hypothetical protein
MPDISFDDLIPKKNSNSGLSFDDLIPAPKQKSQPYSVLPVSEDEQGNPRFDSNAGIFGTIKRAVTLPGDVVTGQVDPMSNEGIARATDLAGVASPVSVAAKTMRPGLVKTPTAEQLYAKADEQFDNARGMGVDYSTQHIRALSKVLQDQMAADGIDATNAPKTLDLLSKLQTPDVVGGMANTPKDTAIPISRLLSDRSKLSKTARDSMGTTEETAANRAINGLQSFIADNPKGAAIRGPADEAARVASEARGNYATAKRSDTIDNLSYNAELNSGAANSGMNVDNAIRQQAKALLKNKKQRAGFSDEEISALEELVKGTPTRNAVRMAGNMLGGGGGLGSLFSGSVGGGVGGYLAGPTGAMVGAGMTPLVGMAAKSTANKMAEGALSNVDSMVRQRSPLYRSLLQQTPGRPISPNLRSLPMRGLLLGLPPDQI